MEFSTFIEDLAKGVLHGLDMFANRDLTAQLFLQVRRARKMVSMDMSFDDPFNGKALSFDIGEDFISLFIGEAARDGVKFHDSVNDGCGLGRRV